jgi:hypothetical protein
MTISGKRIPDRLQIWVDARKRFHLSHAQIQMAREFGLNPKKLGKLANENQEPWKIPLPQFSSKKLRLSMATKHSLDLLMILSKL